MRTLSDFVKVSGTYFGFLTGVTVICSLIYDFGYFSVIGLHYFSMLTTQDHISSFFVAAPYTLLATALGVYFDPPWVEIEKTQVQQENLEKWRAIPTWIKNIPFTLLAVALFIYIHKHSAPGKYSLYAIPLIMLWINIRHSFCERSGIKDAFTPILRWIMYFGGFIIIIYLLGAENAYSQANASKHLDKINLDAEHWKDVTIIRSFTSGLIVSQEQNNKITFYTIDSITGFSAHNGHSPHKDYIDQKLEGACRSLPFLSKECIKLISRQHQDP